MYPNSQQLLTTASAGRRRAVAILLTAVGEGRRVRKPPEQRPDPFPDPGNFLLPSQKEKVARMGHRL
jgi:hypothetical protein